jgi:hypothetical protein
MHVTSYKVPQITGKGNGTGGTPDAPLEYLETSVGSPASSKRPTTRELAGPTLTKNPVRQSHSRGKMTHGD